MKNGIAAVLVVGALLSTSGSTLAAGKLGGAGGMDEFELPPTSLVGKLGGAGGADEFLLSPSLFAGKLGGVTGEEIGARVTGPEDVAGKDIALSTNQVEPGGDE